MARILPPAKDLDVACQNLRAMVRLCPDYESPKIKADREWSRLATRRHSHSAHSSSSSIIIHKESTDD